MQTNKTTTKKNKEKTPTVKESTWIRLQVPNKLYYAIKSKADKDTQKQGEKKTIHDRFLDDLYEANPSVSKK